MSDPIIVIPLPIKAMTDDQLLALYNRWGTKPRKRFDNRICAERCVARLLNDLVMSIEEACAPPSGEGYAGVGWDAAFPEEGPAGPPEATIEEALDEPTAFPDEAAEPQPRTAGTTVPAIGGLPENEPTERTAKLSKSAQTIYALATRTEGASHKELMAATGWKAGPSWPNQFNRLSLRTGTRFRQEKVNGEMRYYLS